MYNSCFKLLVIISIMEWTDNKTKLLIEEFEKHPCLCNCKLDSYHIHNRDLRAVSWQRVAEVCGSTGMIPASKSPYFVEKAIISSGRTDTEFCYQSGYGRYVQYPTQSPMCHSMVPIVCLLYAFFRRSKRCGFCLLDLPSFEEIFEDADDRLFNKINNNDEHVLHCLLPRSRHPQLLHNITNWDKERTTVRCLHAPAVSLTLILSTEWLLFKDIYYRFNNVHYSGSVIAAGVTFIFCYYSPNIGDGKVDTSLEDRRQRWISVLTCDQRRHFV